MANIAQLLTGHMDIWTAAETERKSGRGRASGNGSSVYGVKKLRELILELAVRGKLVPQDPNEEPASELIKRIQAEKAKLIAEGKLKKEKQLAPIAEDEKPFELPQGWGWVYFGEIAQHNSGKTLDKGRNKGVLRDYITTSNLYWGMFELDNVKQMPIEESELEKCTAQKGDLLICEGGEAGRAAVWTLDKEVCFQNHIHRARMHGNISPFYAYRYFEKLNASGEIEQYRKGVGISNMSGKALASVIFALPPLAEQHRIVAKVDELMALCDQLEQQHSNAQEAHETLVSQLLTTLTQSRNAAEFNANWQRIQAHFDLLFTTEASIDALKQTLLQLAVMGKLVPQDPNDEPASELLKRIQAEKTKLIAAGKLKKEKPLAPIPEEEKAFELPKGWEWVKLDQLALSSEAGWSPQCLGAPREHGKWGVLKVSAVTWGEFRPEENKALPDNFVPKPEYEVKAGDFLISRANTSELVAKAVVVPLNAPSKLMMSDKIIRFVISEQISSEFLNLVNNSSFSRSYYAKVAGGTSSSMKNVSREQIRNLVIALPSKNEQRHTVAKVDALMALCDQLKTRLQQASQQQQAIADALVAQAVA